MLLIQHKIVISHFPEKYNFSFSLLSFVFTLKLFPFHLFLSFLSDPVLLFIPSARLSRDKPLAHYPIAHTPTQNGSPRCYCSSSRVLLSPSPSLFSRRYEIFLLLGGKIDGGHAHGLQIEKLFEKLQCGRE